MTDLLKLWQTYAEWMCQVHRQLKYNLTSLCWASSLSSQHDATRNCCWAPAPSTGDRSISAAGSRAQQQTNRTPLLLSIDVTDRQTDTRPLAEHAMRAASKNPRWRTTDVLEWPILLTYILVISILSPPHSFIPGLKPSIFANPSHRSLPFLLQGWLHGFLRTVYRYFWAYPFFTL